MKQTQKQEHKNLKAQKNYSNFFKMCNFMVHSIPGKATAFFLRSKIEQP